MISPPAGCREELQNSSDMRLTMTAVTDFSWNMIDRHRVFASRRIYRRIGGVGGRGGPPRHRGVRAHPGPRPSVAWPLVGLLRLPFGLRDLLVILLTMSCVSSNSKNISLIDFLKPKTAENRELARWHLVNRLVPENA